MIPSCKRTSDDLPDFFSGPSSKIQVQRSKLHGYGVFAVDDIQADELIEESRMLRTGLRANYSHDTVLRDYFWGIQKCDCEECKNHGFVQFIGLGNLSLYNHSDTPNTRQKIEFHNERMTIHAREFIPKGSEIFVNYGPKYWFWRKLWHNLSEDARAKLAEISGRNDTGDESNGLSG